MKDINILYLGLNEQSRITSQGHYLFLELCKRAHVFPSWQVIPPRPYIWDVRKYIDKLGFKPDIIYIGPPHRYWEEMGKYDIPKLAWWSDPHTGVARRIEWVEKEHVDVALHATLGNVKTNVWGLLKNKEVLPDWHKSVLFPHSVETDVFKDYGSEKDIDSLVLGRSGRPHYRLRWRISEWFKEPEQKNSWNIKVTKRPKRDYGWTRERADGRENVYAWDAYAKLIDKCKTFPFCTGMRRYPVAKIFESMASNTIPMFPPPDHHKSYHLEPNKNFVSIDQTNFKEKITYWIDNYDSKEARELIKRGTDTMVKHHSTKVRCDQLMELIEIELQ